MPASPAPAAGEPPPPSDPYGAAVAAGASEEAARLTATVVEAALAAMGSPYSWGGSDANGFDCSGLIRYAYGQVGIVLPRMSRDQMRMGRAEDRDAATLRPGDILGFSSGGTSEVSHVGLYVGEGRFIHSSSTGVKLSSLTATDGDSRWWRDRWVGVRRIVE
jgi:cell wall-associated NlpC family hydrolase